MFGKKSSFLAPLTTALLATAFTACTSQPQTPSCEMMPLEKNVAVREWHSLGGVPSLDDAVALYGYDCSISGPIKGYSWYGIPQERRDADWLRLVKTLMDTGELSEETARRALIWFATEVQDDPAFRGSKWNMESTVYDAVVSAVNTFHLAKQEGLIPEDQPLFLRDLTATWLLPSFKSFSTSMFTPFYGSVPEGYRALGSPSLPALTEDNETFYAFLTLSPDTDQRIKTNAEMPGQGYDFLFTAPHPFPSAHGPDIYYPFTLPSKVVWSWAFPSPYVDDAIEYSFVIEFTGPRKIVPIPDLRVGIGHIVTTPDELPSPFILEGSIIPSLVITPHGPSNPTLLGHTFNVAAGTANFDWNPASGSYPVGYSLHERGMDAWIIDPNVPVEYDWSSSLFGEPPRAFYSLDPRLRGIPRYNLTTERWELIYKNIAPPKRIEGSVGDYTAVPPDNPDVKVLLPPGVSPW